MKHPRQARACMEVCDESMGEVSLRRPQWEGFCLERMRPALRCDGALLAPTSCKMQKRRDGALTRVDYAFGNAARLKMAFDVWGESGILIRSSLESTCDRTLVLNEVTLLEGPSSPGKISFGAGPARIRIFEQGNYWGRVRPLGPPAAEPTGSGQAPAEPGASPDQAKTDSGKLDSFSEFVSVAYDQEARMAFLTGFVTSERWIGRVRLVTQPDGRIVLWHVGFDGGDLHVKPSEEIGLEEVVLAFDPDPWALLARYADAASERHPAQIPSRPPVSWCSWYPYRLSVSEDRILATARLAAQRLKPLGLEIIEVDLGWERGNLPSTFDENERFPHGLKWLSGELEKLGFRMGVWKAPYMISEFDPLSRDHPEWLIQGEDGKPLAIWEWYWEPHGQVFILDLTHAGAREWLRDKVTSLHERGVRYFKADFISCASDARAKKRHDPSVVAGGGCEAARMGAKVIRDSLPDALLLNCGGPEMPGTGQWPLLYTCTDTGNTGFASHSFQQRNHQAIACHLFKNRRWGILQPSCLCVGLPGTVEDARIRATIAFLTGGQIDISDDLASLPEDRWSVLTATLPPLDRTAKPVDLFEPVYDDSSYDYSAVTKGQPPKGPAQREHPAGSVWHVHIKADWDEWDLVGLFCLAEGSAAKSPRISQMSVPFGMLGIPASESRLAYEFWSGQFVGTVPGGRHNQGGYGHPGDFQELRAEGAQGMLKVAFFGPAVKLLCLRRPRPHPWVVGTGFHQSCGLELKDVAWDAPSATLTGTVRRPCGESACISIAANGLKGVCAQVDGRTAPLRPGAHSSLVLPLTLSRPATSWSVKFEPAP